MRNTVNLYKALSDPNRIRILMMLREGPLCVCEIVEILGLANSTISKHLSILRNANLIMDEKEGRWVNYRLSNDSESKDISFVLNHLSDQLQGDPLIASDQKQASSVNRFTICSITKHEDKGTN